MNNALKILSLLVGLFIAVLPRNVLSHGVMDVSLSAAHVCWPADGGDVWRQDNLLGSVDPVQVVCQIPSENRRKLAKVWLRATNIDGFSGTLSCRLESTHPVSNNVVQGEDVRPSNGREAVNIALPVPPRSFKNGYWLVRCDLDTRSVLRGIRYIYR